MDLDNLLENIWKNFINLVPGTRKKPQGKNIFVQKICYVVRLIIEFCYPGDFTELVKSIFGESADEASGRFCLSP